MLRATSLALVALAVATAGTTGASAPPPPALQPAAVVLDAPAAQGPQYLAADRKGRLYLVRGGRPAFYEVADSGKTSPWGDPDAHRQAFEMREPFYLDAALAPDGSHWVLLTPREPLRVRSDEVEILPAVPWRAVSLTEAGAPIAAVLPVPVSSRPQAPEPPPSEPPLLVETDGRSWRPLYEEELPDAVRAHPEALEAPLRSENLLRSHLALHLAPASPSGLWAAHQYLYRVRRFSPAGRALLDLTLDGQDEPVDQPDEEIEKLRKQLEEKAALLGFEGDSPPVRPFTSRPVIRDLAEGRDGRLYLYIAPGMGTPQPQLHRYDPATRTLGRIPLALDDPGRLTLAAGRHALWIAAVAGDHQVWRVPWTQLEDAPWQIVEGVRIDGLPVGQAPPP